VQFDDLLDKIASALKDNKVDFTVINKGGAKNKSKSLEDFQAHGSNHRVLLLNAMNETASGANLTMANHAIFLSPLLTQTKAEYDQNETQAIGRVVRYGQTKHVYIWRFVSRDTIDEEIYRQRSEEVAGAAQEDEEDTETNQMEE
jgi:SNF2 family DNA or RNA helicase